MEPIWESEVLDVHGGRRGHFVGREPAGGAIRRSLCEDGDTLGGLEDGMSLEWRPGIQFVHLSADVLKERKGGRGLVDNRKGDDADVAVITGYSLLDIDGKTDAVCAVPGVMGWDKGCAGGGCDACVVGVGTTEDEDEIADVVGLERRVVCGRGRHVEDEENVRERYYEVSMDKGVAPVLERTKEVECEGH